MTIILSTINFLFQIYTLMLFARILGSWLPELSEYKLFRFICFYTDPYLNFFRRFIPPLGMIDFSPIIAFICLNVMQNMILHLAAKLMV